MKYLFLLFALVGCSANDDLANAVAEIKNCKEFKVTWDSSGLKAPPTKLIDQKISHCRALGAWNE